MNRACPFCSKAFWKTILHIMTTIQNIPILNKHDNDGRMTISVHWRTITLTIVDNILSSLWILKYCLIVLVSSNPNLKIALEIFQKHGRFQRCFGLSCNLSTLRGGGDGCWWHWNLKIKLINISGLMVFLWDIQIMGLRTTKRCQSHLGLWRKSLDLWKIFGPSILDYKSICPFEIVETIGGRLLWLKAEGNLQMFQQNYK